jgi:hypothetical protein
MPVYGHAIRRSFSYAYGNLSSAAGRIYRMSRTAAAYLYYIYPYLQHQLTGWHPRAKSGEPVADVILMDKR